MQVVDNARSLCDDEGMTNKFMVKPGDQVKYNKGYAVIEECLPPAGRVGDNTFRFVASDVKTSEKITLTEHDFVVDPVGYLEAYRDYLKGVRKGSTR